MIIKEMEWNGIEWNELCVCDEEDKFCMKGERRSHARETYDRSERAGCGLHQKVKKLRYTGLGYKPNKIFQFWIFC